MKNIAELHSNKTELSSEISFLKKEIDFLLKMLSNGYSISVNNEKIKLLDGFWNRFEKVKDRLDFLLKKVQREEKRLAFLYQDNLIDPKKTLFKEEGIIAEYSLIYKEVKVLKEHFYEYMSGCCACSFKKINYENSCL